MERTKKNGGHSRALGRPVWMRISGVTVGSLGWSNDQLMVF